MPLGNLSGRRQRADLVEAVERMLLPLGFFLRRQFAAGGDGAVLRGAIDVGGIGGGPRRQGQAADRARRAAPPPRP